MDPIIMLEGVAGIAILLIITGTAFGFYILFAVTQKRARLRKTVQVLDGDDTDVANDLEGMVASGDLVSAT